VILLHYFSGLSHQAIAEILGISPQAVHGRLLRARRKLAEDLRRNGLGRRQQ
jgi:RNA polymerase sigma factor (sigma-70 family)